MKKVLALFLTLTLLLTGIPAAFAEEETVVIGYSSNASDENEISKMDAFRQFVEDWNAAGNTPKLEAAVTVAESSVEKQIADVETLLEMGCKAIALSSVDLEGLKSSVDLCLSRGVPVIECRGMDHEGIITFNLCDEVTMAEMAFSWYEELMDANPDLVLNMGLIYGLASQTAQLVRVDHLVELLQEKYPDRVNVLASQPCDWDTQKAMECMENWLQRFGGEMNCVVAAGAMEACGAVQAVIGSGGDLNDWIFTTTDATADVLYAINEDQVDMTVGIDAYKGGYMMAEATKDAALGELEGNYVECGEDVLAIITPENIGEWHTEEE